MKKFLRLLILSTFAISSHLIAQTSTTCCFPTTFKGNGSSVQGQSDAANINNRSLSVYAVTQYAAVNQCPTFTYNADGAVLQNSPAGIQQTIIAPATQLFGGTDVPPTLAQVCPTGPLLNWPVAVIGIVPFYNLPNQKTPLNFTAEVLADIFAGHFKTWDQVQKQYPFLGLNSHDSNPSTPTAITIVVRGDQSGSTANFTAYLFDNLKAPATPAWSPTVTGFGPFSATQWANAYGPAIDGTYLSPIGTEQVLTSVTTHVGAIGYVGYNNALMQGFLSPAGPTAAGNVENPHSGSGAGPFIPPSPATFALAMQNVPSDPQLRYNTINSPVTGAYPIASPTNLVTLACQFSDCQAIELKKFLYFYITLVQRLGVNFGVGALPGSVVAQFIKQLDCLASSESCISTKVCACCVDPKTGLSTCCTGGSCPSIEKPCPDRDQCRDCDKFDCKGKCKDKCRDKCR